MDEFSIEDVERWDSSYDILVFDREADPSLSDAEALEAVASHWSRFPESALVRESGGEFQKLADAWDDVGIIWCLAPDRGNFCEFQVKADTDHTDAYRELIVSFFRTRGLAVVESPRLERDKD
jgi:hypothetical protein